MKRKRNVRRGRFGAVPESAESRCLYFAVAGRSADVREIVCMTPRRHLRFFGSRCSPADKECPPRKLGCGSFACAYPHKDDDKVVKFTTDPSDLATLRKVGSKYGPRLYEAWRVSDPRQREVHGLVVEYLKPAGTLGDTLGERDYFEREGAFYCLQDTNRAFKHMAAQPMSAIRPHIQTTAAGCCSGDNYDGDDPAGCRRMVADVVEIREVLRRQGIQWPDIKPANVGWSKKDRRWKAIDLGMTEQELEEPLTRLHGRHRRWR